MAVTDVVDKETRSRMMSGIRARNTKPEMLVRKALFAAGYRFRLHRRDLPGVPDIVLPGRKIAIFVHGCFWHQHAGCHFAKLPATRPDFWRKKLGANIVRDKRTVEALGTSGWRVLVVWECATRDSHIREELPNLLEQWINGASPVGEIRGPS